MHEFNFSQIKGNKSQKYLDGHLQKHNVEQENRKEMLDDEFIKYIKKTFDDAKENAPSLVLLDDFDKFANEDNDHKNAEEYVTIQSCIDDIKSSEDFVIATANDLHLVPDSLIRAGRFDINYFWCKTVGYAFHKP